jgi:hypothetical protein
MPVTREALSGIPAKSVDPLISPDGKMVVLQFALDAGKTVNISFDARHATALIHSLSALMTASLNVEDARFERMTAVTQATAHPTDEVGQIALGLIDDAGVPHYFSFPAGTSAALRSSLRFAESKSRSGVRIPRA